MYSSTSGESHTYQKDVSITFIQFSYRTLQTFGSMKRMRLCIINGLPPLTGNRVEWVMAATYIRIRQKSLRDHTSIANGCRLRIKWSHAASYGFDIFRRNMRILPSCWIS